MKKVYFLAMPVAIVALHQLARIIIFPLVAGSNGKIEAAPFFNLVEVWNSGVSFGMFGDLAYGQWLLSGLAFTMIVVLSFLLRQAKDRPTIAAYYLIIGGAAGNMIDRVRFGAVADYLDFHLYGYHWPAFNVTDMGIVSGALLLSALQFFPAQKAEG